MSLLTLASSVFLFAAKPVHTVTVTDSSKVNFTRWMFNPNDKSEKSPVYKRLKQIKKMHQIGNYKACLKEIDRVRAKVPHLRPWMLNQEILCVRELLKSSQGAKKRARRILQDMDRAVYLQVAQPYNEVLVDQSIKLRIDLLIADSKSNDPMVHRTFTDLVQRRHLFDKPSMAKVLRVYGEFLVLRQNVAAAIRVLEQSLELKGDEKLLAKVLKLKKSREPREKDSSPAQTVFIEEKEEELMKRFELSIKAQDYLAAVEDGIPILRQFPYSENAEVVYQTIEDLYLKVLERESLKEQAREILGKLRSAPPHFLMRWSQAFFRAVHYQPASVLLKRASQKLDGTSQGLDSKYLYARALHLSGDYKTAIKIFSEVIRSAAGHSKSIGALFYSALCSIRTEDVNQAVSKLERLLKSKKSEKFQLSAHYWLWVLLREESQERAEKHHKALVTEFPFSYYGLVARATGSQGVVDLPARPHKKFQVTWHFTKSHYEHWKRANSLLRAGWLSEARRELEQLPAAKTPAEQASISRYWAAALDYRKSIRLVNKAWNKDGEFRASNVLQIAYPKEFAKEVATNAKVYSLRPQLVSGLIRQESAFYVRAVSRSGALGLMQLIPPTAQEVADSLAIKNLKLPDDMFSPLMNIRFGTYYLAEMIKRNDGHVGLGLASYNAGPTRIFRFLKSRRWQADSLARQKSPLSDLWIDELPWQETSFYVKAILRNVIIYRTMQEGPTQLQLPYWSVASWSESRK